MAEENRTENTEGQAQQAQDKNEPFFQLVRCYMKDASLEMPHAPEIFMTTPEEQPNVDIQFEVSQRALQIPNTYEVVVRGTITVSVKGQAMFLVEGKQAGIFEIRGIPQEGVHHILNVLCASTIYPYLRANLADLINRTGLPPVHLPEVNFEGLYQQRMAQQAQKQAEEARCCSCRSGSQRLIVWQKQRICGSALLVSRRRNLAPSAVFSFDVRIIRILSYPYVQKCANLRN